MSSKKIYYINSANRIEGSGSDFSYCLSIPIHSNFTYCSVIQASIPKSYYLVQENQNTFTLDENGTEYTITMPIGNYNRSSFIIKLQSLLNDIGSWTYVVTAPDTSNGDPETGKLTYSVSGNGGVQPKFIFTLYLYETMGFNKNSTVSFVGNSLTSSNVINLQKESTLFIHSDLANNDTDNILQDVYTEDSSDYGRIIYRNTDLEKNSKQITTLDNVYRFYLTDENGLSINLNGLSWQMTIILYDDSQKRTNDMIQQYIKYKVVKDGNK